MARHNNISRSLQIMSREQGWDPCKIDGQDYPHLEYDEQEPTRGFRPGAPPPDPQGPCPDPAPPGPDTRGGSPYPATRRGDPFAGKSEGGA